MPAKPHALRYFEFDHLPAPLQEISRPFHALAHQIAKVPGPQTAVALQHLLESKDAAVRAGLAKRDQQ